VHDGLCGNGSAEGAGTRETMRKGNEMKRVLVLLALLAGFVVVAGGEAATTVEQQTFDATFPLCNGDLIHLSGPLLVTTTETSTPSGGLILAIHFQPQGVTGVDLSTGTVFHATGLTRDLTVLSPPGGYTETFVNQFHIQATDGAQSYIVTNLFHITVSPDGTVRSFVDNFSATC
jgi:hypothetical protein